MTEKVNRLAYSAGILNLSIFQDFHAVYEGFKLGKNPQPSKWEPSKNPKEVVIQYVKNFTLKEFKQYLEGCMNCGNTKKEKAAHKVFEKYSWLFQKPNKTPLA
jgi:hypothetical protein